MSSKGTPFYAQAALLDRYVHAENPADDPDVPEIILELLRTRRDLRAYFFRSRPTAAWAPILWEEGFLEAPPPPQESAAIGAFYPRWDVQTYLLSIAPSVPDIVLKHALSIEAPGWYISQAILGLCAIPVDSAIDAVPRITAWLQTPRVARAISENVFLFVKRLAEAGMFDLALEVFGALTAPEAPGTTDGRQAPYRHWEALSRFASDWDEKRALSEGVSILAPAAAPQLTEILEGHLRMALEMEAQVGNTEAVLGHAWWRSAVEDTDQDLSASYKHVLLQSLRATLHIWSQQDPGEAKLLIERYLVQPVTILRRLALYTLSAFPNSYQRLVSRELLEPGNLDDIQVHHEFFMLLERGFAFLSTRDQEALIDTICQGPAEERLTGSERSIAGHHDVDEGEYVDIQRRLWIRDRLWMIRTHLPAGAASMFQELVG